MGAITTTKTDQPRSRTGRLGRPVAEAGGAAMNDDDLLFGADHVNDQKSTAHLLDQNKLGRAQNATHPAVGATSNRRFTR